MNLNGSYDPIHHPADVNSNIPAFTVGFGQSLMLYEHEQVALWLQIRRIMQSAPVRLAVTIHGLKWQKNPLVYIFSSATELGVCPFIANSKPDFWASF